MSSAQRWSIYPVRLPGLAGLLAMVLAALATASPANALDIRPELAGEQGTYRMLGSAQYRVLAWPIFRAELWSSQERFSWDQPFALSLTYQRSISRETLVARSLSSMAERARTSGDDPRLATLLRSCFADVRPGDRFTGISTSSERARFYLNGRQTCDIAWPEFRRVFFGIWLDGRGGDRGFSARLRGSDQPGP